MRATIVRDRGVGTIGTTPKTALGRTPGEAPRPPGRVVAIAGGIWHPVGMAATVPTGSDTIVSPRGAGRPGGPSRCSGPGVRVSAGLASLAVAGTRSIATSGPAGPISWLPLFALVSVVVSTLVHEGAHAWAAHNLGYRVEWVVLGGLSGVTAYFGRDDRPLERAAVALAGPAASAALVLGLLGTARARWAPVSPPRSSRWRSRPTSWRSSPTCCRSATPTVPICSTAWPTTRPPRDRRAMIDTDAGWGGPDAGPYAGRRCSSVKRPRVFLGEDLLAYLVLALGAAMAIGSIVALVRPPEAPKDGELARAPVSRSIVMIVVGTIAALWALASLLSG